MVELRGMHCVQDQLRGLICNAQAERTLPTSRLMISLGGMWTRECGGFLQKLTLQRYPNDLIYKFRERRISEDLREAGRTGYPDIP